MAKFNKQDINPGHWFEYPKGGRIKLRVLPLGVGASIQTQTEKKTVEYKRGQRFEDVVVDHATRNSLTWDYCIAEWEGFEWEDEGKLVAIPCTMENKTYLMSNVPEFALFFVSKMQEISSIEADAEEAQRKNF